MDEQLQQILEQQLRDVHLPEAISWWPLSTAWWVVIVLTVFALSYFGIRALQYRKRNRYRRIALNELKRHYKAWQTSEDSSSYIQGANQLLKRCMLPLNPLTAKLSGQAWTDTLNRHSNKTLSEQTKLALTESIYQARPSVDIAALHQEITQWIKNHKQEVGDV